ncbi:MAG: hypothetical protein ABS52_07750 [Gemmatimonadetes bacterium SCN 70-22]|nr:MAG: hypothetical protein ABS52_07750 [Gemmatimonadetes bacterium SCN 70-22]
MPQWLQELEEARTSGAAGVILTGNTVDRVHLASPGVEVAFLRYAIAHHLSQQGLRVGYHALGTGFEVLETPPNRGSAASPPFADVPVGPSECLLVLSALERVLRLPGSQAAVILDYAELLLPQSSGSAAGMSPSHAQAVQIVHHWAQDDLIRQAGNFIVIVSNDGALHELLLGTGGFRTVRIDLPTEEERARFTTHLSHVRANGYARTLGTLAADYPVEEFARNTCGLRLSDIEYLMRRAAARKTDVTRDDARTEKQHAIAQISRDLVEVVEPRAGFESVAGAAHAKRYFSAVRGQWMRGTASCPQAILLAGVPGCGKSHIVRAVAREFGAPLLIMRNVRDQFVGQSERNLERVLWIAENLSPCILWTDELDQAIGQRSTGQSADGGTSERMLARLFEYFGGMNKRGRILWIGTTNRPDILDPALLDRFQVVLPWIHPTTRERGELIPLLAKQIDRQLAEGIDLGVFESSAALEMLTVRSLQEIIVAAAMLADARTGEFGAPIGHGDLAGAIEDYKSSQNTTEHEFLALKALQMASFTSLLPWMSEGGCDVRDLPPYLRDLVDPATGRMNDEELANRISQRERERAEGRWRR